LVTNLTSPAEISGPSLESVGALTRASARIIKDPEVISVVGTIYVVHVNNVTAFAKRQMWRLSLLFHGPDSDALQGSDTSSGFKANGTSTLPTTYLLSCPYVSPMGRGAMEVRIFVPTISFGHV